MNGVMICEKYYKPVYWGFGGYFLNLKKGFPVNSYIFTIQKKKKICGIKSKKSLFLIVLK